MFLKNPVTMSLDHGRFLVSENYYDWIKKTTKIMSGLADRKTGAHPRAGVLECRNTPMSSTLRLRRTGGLAEKKTRLRRPRSIKGGWGDVEAQHVPDHGAAASAEMGRSCFLHPSIVSSEFDDRGAPGSSRTVRPRSINFLAGTDGPAGDLTSQ